MKAIDINFQVVDGKSIINGHEVKLHHFSSARGYCKVGDSMKRGEEYSGIYGRGYKVYRHNEDSSRYMFVYYYIFA